jgi:hypothetical protein
MKFCDADACPTCSLVEGGGACLRHKARFCMWLATKISNSGVRSALERMSFDLMEEACALERERAVLPGVDRPTWTKPV